MVCDRGQPIDIYRDTRLRYLGYLGSFGLAQSNSFPTHFMRMACLTYILSDIYVKTGDFCNPKNVVIAKAGDAALFHLSSSIIIPSVFMGSLFGGLAKQGLSMASGLNSMIPVAAFVAIAPFVGKYIDSGTNGFLNGTYRKAMGLHPVEIEKEQPRKENLLENEKCLEDQHRCPKKKPIPVEEPTCPPRGCCTWRKKKKCPPPESA